MFLDRSEKNLLKELIKIPSVTGAENGVLGFLKHLFDRAKWLNFEIKFEEQSLGILVVFGTPKVLFTSHVDVVNGPMDLFEPKEEDEIIYGRGACDAKGSVVSMIFACDELVKSGATDFGLFLFAGEERGGKAVLSCLNYLQGFGIEHLIMGEPTNCRMAKSHLGALCLNIKFYSQDAFLESSGAGLAANKGSATSAQKIRALEKSILGFNEVWSVDIERPYSGFSANSLSPFTAVEVFIRTTLNNHADIIAFIKSIVPESIVEVIFSGLRMDLVVLDGYKKSEARMCSSLPYFDSLGANLMMLGPGDPSLAHTIKESISIDEVIEAKQLYQRLYDDLLSGAIDDSATKLSAQESDIIWCP